MTDISKLCQLVIATHRMRESSWDGRMYVICHFTAAEEVCNQAGCNESGVVDLVAALAATGQGQDAAAHYLTAQQRRRTITVPTAA